VEAGAQRVEQPLARHAQDVEVGLAGRQLQEVAGLPARLHDVEVGVDDHRRRREALEQQPVGLAGDDVGRGGARPRRGRPRNRRLALGKVGAAERPSLRA
jgi:hypothetical protein